MNRQTMLLGAAAGLAGVLLAGCGGGGAGAGAVSRASATPVFVTDSFREDFGHVWATLFHVEIVPGSGPAVTLFDDPAGHQIDLRTLRDSTGQRFAFLANATIPAGTYKAVNVTIGPNLQLFRAGAPAGNPIPVDSSIPKDAKGNAILTLTFGRPKTFVTGTNPPLVIDFDLARFVLRASGVLPALAESDGPGAEDPLRHNSEDYDGTASSLSGAAPNLKFTLTYGSGQTVTVVTNASTALYGSGSLSNGSEVEVTGTLDTTTGNLVASRVEVGAVGQMPPAMRKIAFGAASGLDAAAGTFTLTVVRARGFTPGQTTLKVVTNAHTVFRGDGGSTLTSAAFFARLAAIPNVMVQGTYDPATNTLTAISARIDDPSHDVGGEHGNHDFRQGEDHNNWDHGVLH